MIPPNVLTSFPLDWGMLRRSRRGLIFLLNNNNSRLNVVLTYGIPPHTVLLVRKQIAPAAVESRACLRENCAIHFYGFLGFNRPLTAAAFRITG